MYIVKISWLKKAASNCCKIKKRLSQRRILHDLPTAPSMAEQQAKFSQISVDMNQSLSINIPNNMFVLHEINQRREEFTLKTSTSVATPQNDSTKNLHKNPHENS
ncbi:MAG: hypothetical protein LBJ95_00665 [Oscillospiraceae bacterium]|jgi:hypothetical protein|nr:hypothetical protein [Oscillospiraceae bacterium]